MISTRMVRYVVVSSFVGVAVLAIVILSAIAVHQLLSAEPETAAISSLSDNETADSTVPGRVSDSESQQSSVPAFQQHALTPSVSSDASSWSPLSFGAPNAGNIELTSGSGDVASGSDSAGGATGANGGGAPAAGFPQGSGGGGGVASAGGFVGTAGVFAAPGGGGGGFAGSAGTGSVVPSVAAPASAAVAPPTSQDPSSAPASVTPPVSAAPSAPAASNPSPTASTPQAAAPAIAAVPQPASSLPAGPQPASSSPAATQPAGPVADPAKNQAPENFAWTADTILQTPKAETNGGQKTSATLAAEADTLDTGIASVPSPSSLLLTALGLVLVVWYIRRRDLRSQ